MNVRKSSWQTTLPIFYKYFFFPTKKDFDGKSDEVLKEHCENLLYLYHLTIMILDKLFIKFCLTIIILDKIYLTCFYFS